MSLRAPPRGTYRAATLLFLIAGLVLAFMLPEGLTGRPADAQAVDSWLDFAENGTEQVAVFIAHDQDGDPIEWSLSGHDGDLFTIDGGVLAFREPPDYEAPRSRAGGNVYRATIVVGHSTHDVAVTVTDADEAGTVNISRPQPQVDRPLTARLSEQDDGVTGQRWQWARSSDGTTWMDIVGAVSPRRSPTPDDVDMYLRATATYSDKFGSGKTARAVSAYRVEPRTLANAAPSFAYQDEDEETTYVDVSRSVAENSAVGTVVGTVSATDADEDILFYELLDTPDLEDDDGLARFTIDSLSGQIRVGKVLGADSCDGQDGTGEHEDEDSTVLSGDAGVAGDGRYLLQVRVSDPSTATATVNVIVTVTDVNEPPRFNENAPTVLRVRENADPGVVTFGDNGHTVGPATFAATDQDCVDPVAYSLTGDDLDKLDFIQDPQGFAVGRRLDYEEQSSYSLTVVVRSGNGLRGLTVTLEVTLEVVDEEDPGEVSLSQREPQVGREVYATVTDPDGGVRTGGWIWERSDVITVDGGVPSAECREDPGTAIVAVGGWSRIDGATSTVYTARHADVGRCLRATATYTDGIVNPAGVSDERVTGVTEAPVQDTSPANEAPHFLVESGSTSRRVTENTGVGRDIGAPVSAHDDDEELLIYTLGGPDASSFGISRNNGQLRTKAELDYETRRSYKAVVTATDPSGAVATMPVTINVNDVDEPAVITGSRSVDFPENSTAPVASFSARDPEGRSIRWSLGGRDAGRFTISRGTLRFRESPNYEEPHSALEGAALAERNVYRVTVAASGGTHDVTVRVMDVDEAGTVSLDRPQPQVDRPLTARLWEQDEGVTEKKWEWARSGDGMAWTAIRGATSPRRSPVADDVGLFLRATVTYSDEFGLGHTVWAVSAYPVEARTLANAAPSFADQDGDESTTHIDVARSVPENTAMGTAIGDPVTATDPDEDILFYELLDTPDLADEDGHARFAIDRLTGQMRVGKVLGADDGEREDEDASTLTGTPTLPGDGEAAAAANSEYVLRVRVSDPSTASATVNVIVKVTEVNEPPAFVDENAPTLLRVRENQKDDAGNPVLPILSLEDGARPVHDRAFAATDQDSGDTPISYTLSGVDRGAFAIDDDGNLAFRTGHQPDFEDKSSYSITVVARSGTGERRLSASLDVTIWVANAEDPGELSLSQRQPQVGFKIEATLKDPDGVVAITRWVWERSDEIAVNGDGTPSVTCREYTGGWAPIYGAMSSVYAPKPADVGRCLRVSVVYTDDLDDADQRATGVLEVPARGPRPDTEDNSEPEPDGGFVNAAPVFPDQDFFTPGVQSDRTTREVAENTKASQPIGDPVRADDADDDLLIYTLGGEDAGHFRISRNDGQLKTKAELNFEERNSYTVVVTATDPFGAAASIVVTINVTDEDDPPVITFRED